MRGLSPVVVSGGHSSSRCAGLSLLWPLLLWSMGSRRSGSAFVAHGPSRSVACGIFPDQGSNLCPLHWQADSQPLRHQGSPVALILRLILVGLILCCFINQIFACFLNIWFLFMNVFLMKSLFSLFDTLCLTEDHGPGHLSLGHP